MYDLNQIPNDYTVELRNRFKGLDLKELWVEVSNIRIVCEVQPCPLEVTVIVPWGGGGGATTPTTLEKLMTPISLALKM